MLSRILGNSALEMLRGIASTAAKLISTGKVIDVALNYHHFQTMLTGVKTALEHRWLSINILLSTLKIDDINPLLNLYSGKEQHTISELEKTLVEIKQHLNFIEHLTQEMYLIVEEISQADYLEKKFLKNLTHLHNQVTNQLQLTKHQLQIAECYCKTYIFRLKKQYPFAKEAAEQWINVIAAYKIFLKDHQLPHVDSQINLYLVNAYNHKAKIHRALSGYDIKTLKESEIILSYESYQQAVKIYKHKVILNGLGFLFNDWSHIAKDKLPLLKNSLAYHLEALTLDNQDPNTYHGLAYALYQIEKCQRDAKQVINKNNLEKALEALEFAQLKNSNSRICLDKALIYLLLNDENKALENFNRGLMLDPNHVLLRYHRGLLFLNKGHRITALEDLRFGKALSADSKALTHLFNVAIKQALVGLDKEYKMVPSKFNELDLRRMAKQDAFESALRKCANYVHLLRPNQPKPTIFISYAWADKEHQHYHKQLEHEEKVIQLSKELEIAGFNVLLDRWYDVKGKNISEFIEKIFQGYVVSIGTHFYLEKCKRLSQDGKPDPVLQTELYFISHLLRYTKETRDKIIPVLLEGTVEESLPMILHSKTPVDLVKGDRYSEILKLVSAMHQFAVRDEEMMKIVNHFENIKKEIENKLPQDLMRQYGSSMYTLFQKHREIDLEAKETIALQLRSKL